jgi:competence ComEA-like helix-hairpin-helix protein
LSAAARGEALPAVAATAAPRVPGTCWARRAVWAAVAAATVWGSAVPGARPDWQIARAGGGCELRAQELPAEPCPCARWPARLRLLLGAPLALERATAADLELLPGVGPRIAAAIARERAERGGFERVEDLLGVAGVGPRMLERLRPLLAAGEPGCPLLSSAAR